MWADGLRNEVGLAIDQAGVLWGVECVALSRGTRDRHIFTSLFEASGLQSTPSGVPACITLVHYSLCQPPPASISLHQPSSVSISLHPT